MSLSLEKKEFKDIIISSLWALIAWMMWSIIIIVIVFFMSRMITLPWSPNLETWFNNSSVTPLILSLVTFIWTAITMFITYFLLTITNPEKYVRNWVIFSQIAFFSVFTYILITPIYIYVWIKDYDLIMLVFLVHTLVLTFWTSILLEALNNYKNILLWFYWSFLWIFISSFTTLYIFSSLSSWLAKLTSLLILLPLINFLTIFFKYLFEYIYFYYNKYSNLDPLWDIFYQIKINEDEEDKLEIEKNSV